MTFSPPIIQPTQPVGRLFPIDFLKAISIIAVVWYHATCVPISTYADVAISELIISAPLRFCVPVLFTISFFLFERELSYKAELSWSLLKKRLRRLAIPVMFWFSLSAALQLLKGNNPTKLLIEVLTGNIFIGAFYLLVLLQFTPIYFWIRNWFNDSTNVLIVIFLQGSFFLWAKAAIAGTFETLGFYVINVLRSIDRPLFVYWFVYMALGYHCYHNWFVFKKISSRTPIQLKLLVIGITCLIMTIEYTSLITSLPGNFSTFEYALISSILSVLVAFFCVASIEENQLPLLGKKIIQVLSKYSLGIFCINGILSQILSLFGKQIFSEATFNLPEIIVVKLLNWSVLITFSLGLSVLLNRVGLGACVR